MAEQSFHKRRVVGSNPAPSTKRQCKQRIMKTPNQSQIIFYTTPEGDIRIEVFFRNNTVWLTQKKMAELFNVERSVITKHLNNIFISKELQEKSNVQKMNIPNSDKPVKYYNLDCIISVGYRVNSKRATQFRIWATKTLREFIIKGYVLDDKRLKNGKLFGKDYFDELLERIREIRASERRFYQKITDLYAQCSIDYNPHSDITKKFYATVQNRLHWAITGQTAAEIIVKRVNAKKPYMGLTTWQNSPKGKILKSDITIAKNYLSEKEIKELSLIVNMYLDYAELQAQKNKVMTMENWVKKLNAFLKFNDYEILQNLGKVSAEVAKNLAEKEYKKYRITQDKLFISDFDKTIKKILNKKYG